MINLIKRTTIAAALVAGAAISIYPLFFMLMTALQPSTFLFEYPPKLFPTAPTLANFVQAWTSQNFSVYVANSVFVTAVSFLLIFCLSSTMAFAYSRFTFKGKKLTFAIVMSALVIPGLTLIIPQFILINQFGMFNSYPGLIVIYTASGIPFTMFLLKGFFDTISRDIDESVAIDGGSSLRLFVSIILPLSKPAFVPATIFNMLTIWEEFPWALTIINDPLKRTLPIALATFQGQYTTQWGIVFAGSLIAVLPVIVLFVFLQRYFIAGITAGAVKG